jgi:hypothetical protein
LTVKEPPLDITPNKVTPNKVSPKKINSKKVHPIKPSRLSFHNTNETEGIFEPQDPSGKGARIGQRVLHLPKMPGIVVGSPRSPVLNTLPLRKNITQKQDHQMYDRAIESIGHYKLVMRRWKDSV